MVGLCENRVAIVTGAGRGLGREYALALAKAGAKVVVNDLGTGAAGEGSDASPAEQVVAEILGLGGQAIANFDDITDFEAARHLVDAAIESFGGLDVVVNNAGFTRDRMFVSYSPQEWDDVIRVHLRGHFCVSSWACQHWRGRNKQGLPVDARIINTSSGAGLQGSFGQTAYSAAKGGIASMTLVQAVELKRYGITANALAPAARTRMTETAFAEAMKKPETGFDVNDPANVAPLVVWLASAYSSHVTGQVFEAKGGFLMLAQGWRDGPAVDKGERWAPEEIGPAVDRLLGELEAPKPVYGVPVG
jgi:NAD(P)-dependent dehydrogenase (short-subunit alcohol dehydrogenase family)